MSYRATLGLNLGSSKANERLYGQLLTPSGTTYGSAITTGFYNIGSGTYSFDYNSYPDDFRGLLSVYPSGATYSTPYILVGINPETLEYIDQKISTLPSGINSYLSSVHGSGDWTDNNNAGIGNYIANIYAKDQYTDVVGGATVVAYASGTSNMVAYGLTNASTGKASFNLDNGQYRVDVYKYSTIMFENPNYITINGSDIVYNITGTLYTVSAPVGSGNLVRIYAYLVDLGLTEDYDCADMLIKPSGTSNFGSFLVTDRPIRSSPDASGYVYADIGPGLDIRVKIPRANFDYYITTPQSGTLNLASLL